MQRPVLQAVVGTFALLLHVLPSAAQQYPEKPIRIVVPFSAGGGADATARVVAEPLSKILGQSVYVENKPGGATTIGMELVQKAKPDGYTLVWTTSDSISMLPAVKPDIPYNILTDFEFVAGGMTSSMMLVVNSKLPFSTFPDLIAYAKQNPGKLRYASSGVGGGGHLGMALIEQASGVNLVHVPFPGAGPAVTSVVGGHVDAILVANWIKSQVQAGQVRALATTDTDRVPTFPDVPTLQEEGLKGASAIVYYGLLAPSKTPQNIVLRIGEAMGKVLQDPQTIDRINALGVKPTFLPGARFKQEMTSDLEKWKGVAHSANIKITE